MESSLKVEGLDDMHKQLQILLGLGSEKEVQSALMYASTPMFKQVKEAAPAADQAYYRYYRGSAKKRRAGNPDNSRRLVTPGTLKKAVARKRVRLERSVGVGIYIRSKAFYWRFIEYGTPTITAVPFIRPAYDFNKELSVERFKTKMRQRLKQVVNRQLNQLVDED